MAEQQFEFKNKQGQWASLNFSVIFSLKEFYQFQEVVKKLPSAHSDQAKLLHWERVLDRMVCHSIRQDVGWWHPTSWRDLPTCFTPSNLDMNTLPTSENLGWLAARELAREQKDFLAWIDHNDQNFSCELKKNRNYYRLRNKELLKEHQKNPTEAKPRLYSLPSPFSNIKQLDKLLEKGAGVQQKSDEEWACMKSFVLYVPDQGYLDNQDSIRSLSAARLFPSEDLAKNKQKDLSGYFKVEILEIELKVDLPKLYHRQNLGDKLQSMIASSQNEELNQAIPHVKKSNPTRRI